MRCVVFGKEADNKQVLVTHRSMPLNRLNYIFKKDIKKNAYASFLINQFGTPCVFVIQIIMNIYTVFSLYIYS